MTKRQKKQLHSRPNSTTAASQPSATTARLAPGSQHHNSSTTPSSYNPVRSAAAAPSTRGSHSPWRCWLSSRHPCEAPWMARGDPPSPALPLCHPVTRSLFCHFSPFLFHWLPLLSSLSQFSISFSSFSRLFLPFACCVPFFPFPSSNLQICSSDNLARSPVI